MAQEISSAHLSAERTGWFMGLKTVTNRPKEVQNSDIDAEVNRPIARIVGFRKLDAIARASRFRFRLTRQLTTLRAIATNCHFESEVMPRSVTTQIGTQFRYHEARWASISRPTRLGFRTLAGP